MTYREPSYIESDDEIVRAYHKRMYDEMIEAHREWRLACQGVWPATMMAAASIALVIACAAVMRAHRDRVDGFSIASLALAVVITGALVRRAAVLLLARHQAAKKVWIAIGSRESVRRILYGQESRAVERAFAEWAMREDERRRTESDE